jgi:hypothetical protein
MVRRVGLVAQLDSAALKAEVVSSNLAGPAINLNSLGVEVSFSGGRQDRAAAVASCRPVRLTT